jgi:hypothetical protein
MQIKHGQKLLRLAQDREDDPVYFMHSEYKCSPSNYSVELDFFFLLDHG